MHQVQTLWPDIKFEAVVSTPPTSALPPAGQGTYGSPTPHIKRTFASAQITDYFRTPSAWAATLWTPSFYSSTIPALRDVLTEVRSMYCMRRGVAGPAGC